MDTVASFQDPSYLASKLAFTGSNKVGRSIVKVEDTLDTEAS